ncbi:MAG: molecular chaperone DnaJ [Bacteroides sp.]|nr:molecular chaperone DnaJ [Bacteroides sp.]
MKREIERPPKVALCRICKGTGRVAGDEGEFHTCLQCEGSGRVTVSCQMTLDIRPYKPKPLKRH